MADFVATIGLSDHEFAESLKRMEGKTGQAFGRIGQIVESRTQGVRKFVGALSSTVGTVTGIVGAFTAVAGVVALAGTAIAAFTNHARKAREEAERELQARRTLLNDIDLRRLELAKEQGRVTENDVQMQRRRTELTDQRLKQLEKVAALEKEASEVRARAGTSNISGIPNFLLRGDTDVSGVEQKLRIERSLLEQINDEIRDIEAAEERRLKRARDDAALDIRRQEIQLLQLTGRETDALRAAEKYRYQQAVEAIQARTDLEQDQIDALLQNEKRIRDLTLERIRKIDVAQLEADENARRRQEELLAREKQSREDLEKRVQIENLRAKGQNEQADAIQRQLDLERQIREIEQAGFDDATKRRLIERASETSRLQGASSIAAAATATTPSEPRLGARSLNAGLGGGATLLRQTFGRDNSAEREAQATRNRMAQSAMNIEKLIERALNKRRIVV